MSHSDCVASLKMGKNTGKLQVSFVAKGDITQPSRFRDVSSTNHFGHSLYLTV